MTYLLLQQNAWLVGLNRISVFLYLLSNDFVQNRASVVFSLQTWLAETPEQKKIASTPGYFSVGMACECMPAWGSRWTYISFHILTLSYVVMAVVVVSSVLSLRAGVLVHIILKSAQSYLPLFLPPPPNTVVRAQGTASS